MRRTSTLIASTAGAALLLVGCSPKNAQPEDGVGTAANWTAPGGGADEAGYSRLDLLTPGNIDKLGLAWSLDLPDEVTLESTPLAIDGTLYFSGGYAEVYAVDALTGTLKWKYDPETWKRRPDKFHFGANRGIAYEDGRIFTAEMDGRVDALDAKTGKVLWSAESIPPEAKYNNSTGAPRTMNGKVIIGNAGADIGGRGFVTAFDSKTGKLLWRFYTTPGSPDQNKGDAAMEAAAKTWHGEYWKTGTGGTVWNGMTFDAEANRIYLGVGNAGPYDPEKRSPGGGDNLYTSSIVALDAGTGKYLWHYQENPRDSWDYKATPNIVMATLTLDGKPTKVLLHAPTNGFFYVLDRDTGKLVNEPGKTTLITWAKGIDRKTGRPIENPDIRYEKGATDIWPGTVGGHNWQAMSYSPRTGLTYIPVQQVGARFSRNQAEQGDDAFNIMGLVVRPVVKHPGDGKGKLVAWDPVAQKEAWSVQHDLLWNGGTLATAGGLVFQGLADGYFHAYDARDGKDLWKFNAGLGIIAAPMSFSVGGKQYVSVLVGWGGTVAAMSGVMDVGWKYGAQTRRLLTFALDGKAALPKEPPRDMKVHALDDPKLVLDEKEALAGRGMSIACASCHGAGFRGSGAPGPDLRESGIALDYESFRQVVKEGRMAQGMPAFQWMTDDQIRKVWTYIRIRARESLGTRKAVATGQGSNPTPAAPLKGPVTY
ncbi:PQQ-dependent dehydrogenase, methanol/ethanol family [Sphingobium sufflavum]|uniref:PQQ-dependent dehydrogenase, methanol/ethanol family n=1 Tax=Sphingobium sufflavum TaxID=1129547 RepID=UPI001F3A77F0|nr:PQQ-dependent dehydrogenase, methanol/ethanol family [Sphingobium sufflavum]MCE7796500.1 PQQ-dependent dehydrogenase, methanol/ethanol family [Sphingobium sufflavum]